MWHYNVLSYVIAYYINTYVYVDACSNLNLIGLHERKDALLT